MRPTKSPSWIERLCGLDPVPAPPHVFTLKAQQLLYGSVHHTAQGSVFETSRALPLADVFTPGVLGGPLREPASFSEQLGAFVEELPGPIREASLVLPDSWLRLIFSEFSEIPRRQRERDEVLRWKLKRLVPFGVDDLRISALEVAAFPHQEEPRRVLLGFALEILLTQLEEAFRGAGIELGRITNTTLALLAGIEDSVAVKDLAALVNVQPDAFTLSYLYRAEPLLYRFKAFGEEGEDRFQARAVRRDLRLTISFVEQQFPELPLHRLLLAAPPEEEALWLEWLDDEFEATPEPLGVEHFSLNRAPATPSWLEMAPLLGAAAIEVS